MANIIWKYCLLCKHCPHCRYYHNNKNCFHWRIFYIITVDTFSQSSSSSELCHNIKIMAWAFNLIWLWVDPSSHTHIYIAYIKQNLQFFFCPYMHICTKHWFRCGHASCDILWHMLPDVANTAWKYSGKRFCVVIKAINKSSNPILNQAKGFKQYFWKPPHLGDFGT